MFRLLLLFGYVLAARGQELLSTLSCTPEERASLAKCGRSLGQFQEPLLDVHSGSLREFLGRVAPLGQISSCYIRACESLKGQPNKALYIEESLLCIYRLLSKGNFGECLRGVFPANARGLPIESLVSLVPQLVRCADPYAYQLCGPSVVNLLHLIDTNTGLCMVDLQGPEIAPPSPQTPLRNSLPPAGAAPPATPEGKLGKKDRLRPVLTPPFDNPPGERPAVIDYDLDFHPPGFTAFKNQFKPALPSRQFAFKEPKEQSAPPQPRRPLPASSASFSIQSSRSEQPMPTEIGRNQLHHQPAASFNLPSLPPQPEFTCTDHQGNSVPRGDEYIDEERAFFLRCPHVGREPEIVACVDAAGERKDAGERWRTADGFFVNECVIGPPGPTTHRTVACVDARLSEVSNGSDWLVGRFFQRCVLDPFQSGWSFIKVVGCEDDYGNRVVNGTEWPSREFMYYRRCALDNGDGQNRLDSKLMELRIVTVACTDENGGRVEDGESWVSLDGLFTKTCRIDPAAGSGQIESGRREVVADPVSRLEGCLDDEGNLVVNGSEWEVANGRFLKACRLQGNSALVPVVACVSETGQRVENGTEWPSLDFLYFQRCHLDNGDGRNRIFTVGCADDVGAKREDAEVWQSRDGATKKCVLDSVKGTGQIEILDFDGTPLRSNVKITRRDPEVVCSLEDGRRFTNGTQWLMDNKRFYQQCVIGDGWFNTPVVACVDDLGNRVLNGTIFPTIDFLYFQRCQLHDGQGLNRIFTVACSNEAGERAGHLDEWVDANGVRKRCVLDANKGTGQIQLIRTSPDNRTPSVKLRGKSGLAAWGLELAEEATCIDEASGKVVANGTEWLPPQARFYKRCVVEEGWSYIAVVACVDDFGNRVPNGTVWPTKDLLYFQRCSLDSGDGLNRIFTVGCADESGARREDGAEWLSRDQRTRKRCRINHFNGTGQIEVYPNLSPASQVLQSRENRRSRLNRSRSFS